MSAKLRQQLVVRAAVFFGVSYGSKPFPTQVLSIYRFLASLFRVIPLTYFILLSSNYASFLQCTVCFYSERLRFVYTCSTTKMSAVSQNAKCNPKTIISLLQKYGTTLHHFEIVFAADFLGTWKCKKERGSLTIIC